MKTQSLLILVVLALLLAAGAYFAARKTETGVPSRIGQKPFAGRDFNAVTQITIVSPGATTRVIRAESGWVLPDIHQYGADFEKIRSFIRTLAELKIGDVLRLNDAQKGELDLNEPGAPAGAGTQILLSGPNNRTIARLLVGQGPQNPKASSDERAPLGGSVAARFVALEDGDLVLVNNPLSDLPRSAKDWMDSQFLAPPSSEIVRLSVTGPDRTPVLLARTNTTTEWTLAGLPPTNTLDAEKISRITSALGFLRFSEVADPALTAEKTGWDHPARLDAETDDGRRYSVLFGQSEAASASRYIRVEMAYTPPPSESLSTNAAALAQAATACAQKTEEVQKFNKRFGTWTYTLDEVNANLLLPRQEDLLQQTPPPPAENDSTPAQPKGDN